MTQVIPDDVEVVTCSCYGCAVARERAGIPHPDRSAEPCSPPDACAKDGQCWTHSEWIDMTRCDPPNACEHRIRCEAHREVQS